MKIAVTNHHRALVGGTESYLNGVIPALEQAGADVVLFHEADVTSGPTVNAQRHTQDWNQLEAFAPDVIFNNGLQSAGRENGFSKIAPVVHFAHNYHGTCISGEKTRKLPSPEACPRRFGAACLAEYFPRHCGGWNPLVAVQEYRVQSERLEAIRRANLVMVASRHMEAEYRQHGLDRIVRAPLFVTNAEAPGPRSESGMFRILFAGRMTRLKGARLLAEAVRQLPFPWEVTFAGDGPERAEVERICPEADFPRWVSQAELRQLAAEHDVFAMPSIWPEPFGLAGLELGLPVAAFAVGGISDWLTDGYNGALAASVTALGLRAALVRCAENRQGRANMRSAMRNFTRENHMRILWPALESVCQSAS